MLTESIVLFKKHFFIVKYLQERKMHGFILYSTLFEYKGQLSYKEKVIFMAIFREKPM